MPNSRSTTRSSVLLLRFSAMGDVAMTAAAVREFAAAHPQQEFTMVSRPLFAPLFTGTANISFIPADFTGRHKGLRGLLRLFDELRRTRPAVVADMHDVLRTKILRCLFRLSGVPVKVLDKGRREKRQLTRRRHKKLHPLRTMHQRYLNVLSASGEVKGKRVKGERVKVENGELIASSASGLLAMTIENENSNNSQLSTLNSQLTSRHPSPPNLLVSQSLSLSVSKKVGIAPFAKYKEKIYPLDRMERVVARLAEIDNVEIFLFGGGQAEVQQLAEWESKYPSVTSLAGKISFSEELLQLGHMNVVVSMDSANLHLASFMGVPAVSLWGATHPYAGFTGWQQPADNNVQIDLDCRPCSVFGNKPCYRKNHACMNISENAVIEKIMNFLH